MWDSLLRLNLCLRSAENVRILLISKTFHVIKKTDSAFLENDVGCLLMFIGNISTMPPQGLEPTWLDEAHLKSKNPNNVSLVSCAEHALKWNIKSLSHLSTWKRFTSDWAEFIRKTHHSSPAQEPTADHAQLSMAKFCWVLSLQVSCPKFKFWLGISSVTQSHWNKIATPPQNPLYCLSLGAHPFSDWHPPPRTKTGHVVWAEPFSPGGP